MANFYRTQGFNGTCAPFVYIAGCMPEARQAYMNVSRFWLAANSLALICLVVAFVYRSIRVSESFNTLRLAMICFAAGVPLHIIYDALRVGDYNQHGVPVHIMGFLWVFGWVPDVSGMLLLIVTWVSFASKNLLARPALTGNPALFWGIDIPYVISSIVLPLVSGINYWHYFIAMRICICSWSAMFLVLALFASYYGYQTLSRLNKGGDSFNYRQQLRVLVIMCLILFGCGISLGVQGYFLEKIDNFYQIFLLCTSLYRVSGFFLTFGSAIYVWAATSYWQKTHSTGSSFSADSQKKSGKINSQPSKCSKSNDEEEEEEEDGKTNEVEHGKNEESV